MVPQVGLSQRYLISSFRTIFLNNLPTPLLKKGHLWHFAASILACPYFLANFSVAPPYLPKPCP